jgi:hypothetical protein
MPESLHPVLARAVHGIEWIARDEIRARLGVEATAGHRELRFRAPLCAALLELGTVDDVFLVLAEIDGVARTREALRRLSALELDLDTACALLGREGARTFDVTASFLGRRNYTRYELEAALTAAGWRRVQRRGALSLRIHVAGDVATVGVRVAARPLHRRPYRIATVRGSLHPPLARALALLGGGSFLDPFCGAGTIVVEGALAGLPAEGSDLDRDAVRAAGLNAAAAGVDVRLSRRDAAASDAVDCIVTNPPWGRALPASRCRLPEARRSVVLTTGRAGGDGLVLEQPVRVHGALAHISVSER